MKKQIISIIISMFITLILLLCLKGLEKNYLMIENRNNKLNATQEVNEISIHIQNILNLNMKYTDFFDLLIKNNPNISTELIEGYSNNILKSNDIIDNIAIAPNAIVKYVYPLEGNESAVGHDLLNDPKRKEYIEKCIELRESVAQGPVESKQGGLKIFTRRAIFVNDNGEEKFWGVSSIAIDFEKLLEKINFSSEKGGYLYSLKINNASSNGDFLWGHDEIFDKDSIVEEIEIFGETWEVAIYPKNGWNNKSPYTDINYLIYFILIIIFFLTYFCINHYQTIREAAKLDPLTEVYNKRYFEKYVTKRIKESNKYHGLILIDLNKFKNINDTMGHPIGDKVLKEATNRIRACIGNNDKLGRIGGDEFFIFVYNVKNKEKLFDIMNSIKNNMKIPMNFGEHKVELTCSLGVAIYNEDGKTYSELYNVADKRMYDNKITRECITKLHKK